jgi:7-cyano-7-deazaguanine synthase
MSFDALDGGIASKVDRFAELLERFHQRVVIQQHLVIGSLSIHPFDTLDVASRRPFAIVERAGPRSATALDHAGAECRRSPAGGGRNRNRCVCGIHTIRDYMSTALLLSGGLDSAVLLADKRRDNGVDVQPVYVSVGLAWEDAERSIVSQLMASAPFRDRVRPLVSLTVDMRDVYAASHWAIEGKPPAYHTPDEDVYLPGRNVVLLGKAGVYCAAAHIDRIVLGTLGHNPFPDATPAFRAAMASALSLGLAHTLQIEAPYADISKAAVIRRGAALGVPFTLTLSCMAPVSGAPEAAGARHCGRYLKP